ncbi:MAG: tyrosine--tRNA ligase [Oscillospiraceae bacterium]|nr:tyrosine--tRNA ligase [Oscillospiraceae bacterium]
MKVYDELCARGLLAQSTDEEGLREKLNNGCVTFYIGFDPTADSLHVGHFLQMVIMKHLQQAGHRPIAIMGGGTGMIGDPSGKSDMRKMLTPEIIDHNVSCFKKQMSRFIDFSDGKAMILNNADWLMNLNYIDFLREVGVHFTVNRMLAAECFKIRYERGLTFFEFNYMLMQAYDFYKLYTDYGCTLEMGGDDQWSNILAGTELIRRKTGGDSYGMTFKLLTTSDGRKMGKTEKGAVWLDPEKTSPYEFYQYWRNTDDCDVVRLMKMLTFVPLEEIAEYEVLSGSELNPVKVRLAYELTKMVHGEEEAAKARDAAGTVFGASAGAAADMPSYTLSDCDFTDGGIIITDLLVKSGLAPSKGEARRLVSQGGISVNEEKISDFALVYAKSDFENGIIIRKGKKIFLKINI